jgi:hypothetical protein
MGRLAAALHLPEPRKRLYLSALLPGRWQARPLVLGCSNERDSPVAPPRLPSSTALKISSL